MKVFSIRVPDEVKPKLDNMDKDYIRKVLIEVAGMTYNEEKRLITIEKLVKKYIEEHIGELNNQETKETDADMTSKAMDTILSIME